MNQADILIAVFPQSDGSLKRRPALALREMPPFQDFLICGISTQLHQEVEGFDEIIRASDPDFKDSGLDHDSLYSSGVFNGVAAQGNNRLGRFNFRRETQAFARKIE
jgi:mRNA interferase MazF